MKFMKKLISLFVLAIVFSVVIFSREVKFSSESNQAAVMNLENNKNNLANYECTDGWRITGYFTPIETDYASADTREIEIKNFGKVKFNSDFLRVVFDEDEGFGEGWGKTRFGWYLGNYNGAWHKADAPLDAHNTALDPNSVAVDNAFVPNESIVKIPGLPGSYGEKTYIANDIGVTVHGKHIDVYCGEGKLAEEEMNRVTFEDDNLIRVCFKKP